jgi:2'-5' RNA ligase
MRLFIAASFPEAALRPLNERLAKIRSRLPHASWVRPETQHLTFAFLGEQDESLVEPLAAAVTKAIAHVRRFEGTLAGAGFFPHPRHARVGWVGVRPEEPFIAIANGVRDAVQSCGVTLDRAEFRPHLTIMRMRDRWPPASIDLFASALRDFVSAPFAVDHVTLYSSRLNPNGAIHTPLREFALA